MAKNRLKDYQVGALAADAKTTINNNFADVSLCSTQFDAVTSTTGTTLTNVVGMVTDAYSLTPGTYEFQIYVAGVSTANCGIKLGLKQSVSSMLTSIESTAKGYTASAVAVQHSTTATDAASLFAQTAAVIAVEITGTMVIAKAGTLQLQAAQNAAHADTTSVYVGSYMKFTRVGN